MSEPESVEQLAERMLFDDAGHRDAITRMAKRMSDFLRSHGIDQATMQAGEKEQPSQEWQQSMCGRFEVPKPPPPEPVVTERDIAAQTEIAQEIFKRISKAEYNKIPTSLFSYIIARNNAAEREEYRKVKEELDTVREAYLCFVGKNKTNAAKITDLQTQLAESQRRVAELERIKSELAAERNEAGNRVVELEKILTRMQPWAGRVIDAMGNMCLIAAGIAEHPATQPSHEGRDGVAHD